MNEVFGVHTTGLCKYNNLIGVQQEEDTSAIQRRPIYDLN